MHRKSNNNRSSSKSLSGKTFPFNTVKDLIEIRDYGRCFAGRVGFEGKDQTLIATALSEICRNVIEYAGSGTVSIKADRMNKPRGIVITISDDGPGIDNIEMALQEGYSTGKGLGVGLPGAKRIMDEFNIESEVGWGTTVKMSKWLDDNGI